MESSIPVAAKTPTHSTAAQFATVDKWMAGPGWNIC